MAVTYAYPTTTPELQDLLIGTEIASQGGEDAPRTRTFTMQSVVDLATATFIASSSNLYAPKLNPVFSGTVTGVTKAMVGLSNVDNTTDESKPISTATQTALNLKANIATPTFTGLVTAQGFKTPTGTNAQFLMADGTTTTGASYTVPTLQQVTTAGPTSNKTITLSPTSFTPGLVINGFYPDEGLLVLNSTSNGTGLKSAFVDGNGIYVSGTTLGVGAGIYIEAGGGPALIASSVSDTAGTFNTQTGSTIAVFKKAGVVKASISGDGNVTANSFVKSLGTSAQYLMANGDTTTMPTLQQVTTANATATNTITINKTTDQSALIITGSASDPVSSLISLTADGGACLKASAGGGGYNGIESYSASGYGIFGSSDSTAGVNGQSAFGVGVAGSSADGWGGTFYSAFGAGLEASTNSGVALQVIGSSSGSVGATVSGPQGINVTKGGISITGTAHTGTTSQLSLSLNSATKPTSNTWTIASDSRVKTNINPYTKGLETILAINPITYDYNGKAGFDTAGTGNIGIIAQDVLNVIPESINTFYAKLNEEDEEKTELYNFDSHALTFILINAIKQLNAEIELLKSK